MRNQYSISENYCALYTKILRKRINVEYSSERKKTAVFEVSTSRDIIFFDDMYIGLMEIKCWILN